MWMHSVGGEWEKDARKSEYVSLGDATALINGVGGIGAEGGSVVRGVWDAGYRLGAEG